MIAVIVLGAFESIGVFVAGLLARLALLLVVLAILAIPAVLIVMVINGYALARRSALGVSRVDGLDGKRDLYYAPGHTWVKWQGARALRVGVDDLARRLLSGARSVELPRVGTVLREGEVASVIACGNKRAQIASPVEGVVTAVNRSLGRDPSLLQRDPYARGWLFAVAPTGERLAGLRRGELARSWLRDEGLRLTRLLERDLGVATADGGEFLFPAPSLLSDAQWEALTRAFLQPS